MSAVVAALAALPGAHGPRLRALLAAGPAQEVWDSVVAGRVARLPGVAAALGPKASATQGRWAVAARAIDVGVVADTLTRLECRVLQRGVDGYPVQLLDDPEPPEVLFARGDEALAAGGGDVATVAIVGTRQSTRYGDDVARELGRDLAAAGVIVVSGLALGIDGAAHEGALAAGSTIAVVGSGIDVVYPRRHRSLWARIAESGAILSEAPLGAAPEPWRFPQRNRVLAGLADVVVVVESHAGGGSMLTVQAAADRDIPVMAVPGSVRSPSSAGTNRLLADGAVPATDATDVLVALSLVGRPIAATGPAGRSVDTRPVVEGPQGVVLNAVDWSPTATEDILRRTKLSLGDLTMLLSRLELAGHVRGGGGWWERTASAGG